MEIAKKIKEASQEKLKHLPRAIGFGLGAAATGITAGSTLISMGVPPVVMVGAAIATLVSLKGKQNEKSTKKKFLLASLAMSFPSGPLLFLLPTPVNPISYLKRKAKQEKEGTLEKDSATNASMPPDLAKRIAALPLDKQKTLDDLLGKIEKENSLSKKTPPPLKGDRNQPNM